MGRMANPVRLKPRPIYVKRKFRCSSWLIFYLLHGKGSVHGIVTLFRANIRPEIWRSTPIIPIPPMLLLPALVRVFVSFADAAATVRQSSLSVGGFTGEPVSVLTF